MPETLIMLRSQQLGVPVAVVPLLWAALHVVRSSTSFTGGALSDRLGPTRTMWLGWAADALIARGFAGAPGAAPAWAVFLALGVLARPTGNPQPAPVAQSPGAPHGSRVGRLHTVTR